MIEVVDEQIDNVLEVRDVVENEIVKKILKLKVAS